VDSPGVNTERISSEDWFSRAVLNDSARDDEFLSLGAGRINDARLGFRGGVKSGVVSSEGFRECAGGVGGRSGRPIRFDACLRVRGLRS
jgi:hypothetical protein